MTLGNLIGRMLDQGYARAADATLQAVAATTSTPLINQRRAELLAEAQRLAEKDEKLTPDNAVLRALVADLEPALVRSGKVIDGNAGTITTASAGLAQGTTKQMALAGMTPQQTAQINAIWNEPSAEAINALVDYADKPAWRTEIKKYPSLTIDVLLNQAVRGMVEGWGPQTVARNIVRQSQQLPVAKAQILTRTLYLESYRSATALNQQVNADILVTSIRIGTLDDRICLCCLALHGTEVPVGQKISDHHAGRCTTIAVVKGRPRQVMTGEQWFASLPEARQMSIAGPGAFEALKSGQANLKDFVQNYSDPVFGQMVREASLKSLGVR